MEVVATAYLLAVIREGQGGHCTVFSECSQLNWGFPNPLTPTYVF